MFVVTSFWLAAGGLIGMPAACRLAAAVHNSPDLLLASAAELLTLMCVRDHALSYTRKHDHLGGHRNDIGNICFRTSSHQNVKCLAHCIRFFAYTSIYNIYI